MHVIWLKLLRAFWGEHPDAEGSLRTWHRVTERARWKKFADVRDVYPHADQVGHLVVFNIGGNKYRLIAAVHYDRGKVYVRHVLTHKEYDEGRWKTDAPSPTARPPKGAKKDKGKPP